MTTLLLNSFLVLLTLFFGAMAYYPLFLKDDTEQPAEEYGQDIVISVVPATRESEAPVSIARRAHYSTRDDNDPEHPGHRPAA